MKASKTNTSVGGAHILYHPVHAIFKQAQREMVKPPIVPNVEAEGKIQLFTKTAATNRRIAKGTGVSHHFRNPEVE